MRLWLILAFLLSFPSLPSRAEDPPKPSPAESETEDVKEFLDRCRDWSAREKKIELDARCEEIRVTLKLPADRAKRLHEVAEKVSEQYGEWARAATKDYVSKKGNAEKKLIVREDVHVMSPGTEEAAEQEALWEAEIGKILTADEVTQLQSTRAGQDAARVRVIAKLSLALLDAEVAFTAEQRARLEPVLVKSVDRSSPALFPTGANKQYFEYSLAAFRAVAGQADQNAVKSILDEVQLPHWNRVTDANYKDEEMTVPPPPAELEKNLEPEYVQEVLSEWLFEKMSEQQESVGKKLVLEVEDAVRVAGLDQATSERLQTAAKGAAARALDAWTQSTISNVLAQIGNVNAAGLKVRLGSLQPYYWRLRNSPGEEADWVETVKRAIPFPKYELWQKEVAARAEYRNDAIAQMILSEFDRKFQLTTEQGGKLRPVLAKAIAQYGKAIDEMFTFSGPSPWYLRSHYCFMPMGAITDEEFKTILGPEQWKIWSGSQEYGMCRSYWENIVGR